MMAGRKSKSGSRVQADPEALASNPFADLGKLIADAPEAEEVPSLPVPDPSAQAVETDFKTKLVVRKQSKGHGGKTVTIVEGLPLTEAQVNELARTMRKALGCGSRVEHSQLILHGERQGQVADWLRERGWTRVVVGN